MFLRGLPIVALALSSPLYAVDFGFVPQPQVPTISTFSPHTEALLRVRFDCFLQTGVSCVDLEKALFEADQFVTDAGRGQADITVEVRAWNLPDSDQYEIAFKGAGDLPMFKLAGSPLQIKSTFSSQAKLLILQKFFVQGLSAYHKIESFKSNPDGTLVVTYRSSDGTNPPPNPAPYNPWYVSANAGATINSYGALTVQGRAGATIAYDTPTWLVTFNVNGSYQYVSEPIDGSTLSAQAAQANARLLVARSIAKHWSVVAMARETYDQVNNWNSRAQLHAGVEYELIPFLETNDNALTVSYLIGGNYENYIEPNVDNKMQQALATQALSLYYVRHVVKTVDVSVAGAVSSLVNDPTKFAIGASATLRFYLAKGLTFDVSGNLGYKNNIINAPAAPDTSNPLYILIGGASVTQPFTYYINMTLTYTWGNTLIRQKDMRWQTSAADLPVNF